MSRAQYMTLLWAIVAMLVILAIQLTGCGSDPPRPARPDIVIGRRDCLAEPPPAQPMAIIFEACPGDTFAACITRESLVVLLAYVDRLRSYSRDAWTMCGKVPVKGEQP